MRIFGGGVKNQRIINQVKMEEGEITAALRPINNATIE
jgi:hypothetical protein